MNYKPFSAETAPLPTDNRPLVSIIMPTHNAGRYIGQAIESVLAQTYTHWELLIIDDASSDNTELIVRAYPDPRIRYKKVERIGHPAGVRNAGLRLAQGEFIAFLDSDDLYYPQTLAKLSAPLLNNPALISVYGFAFEIDEQGQALPGSVQLLPNPEQSSETHAAYVAPRGYQHSWEHIVTSKISNMLAALMIRRSAVEKIGFFNETLCGPEDYEFYVRMFLHDHAGVQCLPDYMYQYRIHSASLTKAPEHCYRLLDSCLKIMRWLFNEAPIPAEAHPFKSRAYVACYRYLSRERLLNHQPGIARQLAFEAFRNENIKLTDALKACGPILVRSLLPTGVDQSLVRLRRTVKTVFANLSQPPHHQAGANV